MNRGAAGTRIALALAAMASASGCATPGPATSAETFVDGRVVATRELGLFVGDVETGATGVLIARSDAAGGRLVALDRGTGRCTAAADGRRYRFTLVHRREGYPTGIGIRDPEDRNWSTDLDIASCAPLP